MLLGHGKLLDRYLAAGGLTVKAAQGRREMPFAAIPFLFGVQQLIEGVIWLTFRHEAPLLNAAMTQAYSFFSHVLWPAYVPVAVLLLESAGWRRTALRGLSMTGVAVGAFLMYTLLAFSVVSQPTGQHIEYVSPHFFGAAVMSLYLVSTTLSPIVSSHAWVRVFGGLALLSFGPTYYFYAKWFISVWCFFAAVLSLVVCAHFARRNGQTVDVAPCQARREARPAFELGAPCDRTAVALVGMSPVNNAESCGESYGTSHRPPPVPAGNQALRGRRLRSGPGAGLSGKAAPPGAAALASVLTCPHCGHAQRLDMPTDACLFFHECPNCKALLVPKAGDCCVFCSYGTVPCPSRQGTGASTPGCC